MLPERYMLTILVFQPNIWTLNFPLQNPHLTVSRNPSTLKPLNNKETYPGVLSSYVVDESFLRVYFGLLRCWNYRYELISKFYLCSKRCQTLAITGNL